MRRRFAQHVHRHLTTQAGPKAGEKAGRPQLPPGFSGHDFAALLLHTAAEIEHVLMVQYLYAAYSLGGEQIPRDRREQVRRWQQAILGIAKEEMGHLITVQNMLRLLGAPLNLERNDYPWDAPFYPFEFRLERLSRASLARYIFTESPDHWPPDIAADEKEEIVALATSGEREPVHQIGKLYDQLIDIIGDPDLLPDDLFQADTLSRQASWDEWGRSYRQGARGASLSPGSKSPDMVIATAHSRATAVAALKAVARQGEAPRIGRGIDDESHFRRFIEIFRAFPKEQDGWSPTLPVATNPRVVGEHRSIENTAFIANPRSRSWAQLLNLRYRMLLAYLSHAFNLSGADGHLAGAKARGMVVHRTFGEMYNIRVISELLVHLPLDKPDEATRAGPPFEMPYTVNLPVAERDCWRLHLDLLEASAALIQDIERFADGREREYLKTLSGIDRESAIAIERLLGAGSAVAMPCLDRSPV